MKEVQLDFIALIIDIHVSVQLLTNDHIYYGQCKTRRIFLKNIHNRNFNRYMNQHLTVIIFVY